MDNRGFNDGLGDKLKAADDAPKARGKRARMLAAVAIVLVAAVAFLATNIWIGS